jgi:hypothetical protein
MLRERVVGKCGGSMRIGMRIEDVVVQRRHSFYRIMILNHNGTITPNRLIILTLEEDHAVYSTEQHVSSATKLTPASKYLAINFQHM